MTAPTNATAKPRPEVVQHHPTITHVEYRTAEPTLRDLTRFAPMKLQFSHGHYQLTVTMGKTPQTFHDPSLTSLIKRAGDLYQSYFPAPVPTAQEAA